MNTEIIDLLKEKHELRKEIRHFMKRDDVTYFEMADLGLRVAKYEDLCKKIKNYKNE